MLTAALALIGATLAAGHQDLENRGMAGDNYAAAAAHARPDVLPRFALQRLGDLRLRHSSGSLAVSPDGRQLLSAGLRGARLFDATTGQIIRSFYVPSSCWAATFSPDGRRLAYALDDGRIAVVDLGQESVRMLRGHAGAVTSLRFLRDGQILVSSSEYELAGEEFEKFIRFWDLATGRQLSAHLAQYYSGELAVSADERYLASIGHDKDYGELAVWKLSGRSRMTKMYTAAGPGHTVAFTPDEKRVFVGAIDGRVVVRDAASGRVERSFQAHTGQVAALVVGKHGNVLWTAGEDGTVREWDFATGRERGQLTGRATGVSAVAVFPDERRLAYQSGYGVLRITTLPLAAEPARAIPDQEVICAVAFSPDGRIIASGENNGLIRLWDAGSGEARGVLHAHKTRIEGLAFVGASGALIAADGDGSIRVWNPGTQTEAGSVSSRRGGIGSLALSPLGDLIASANDDGSVSLWDSRSLAEVFVLENDRYDVHVVAFSPDGKRLAGAADYGIRLWDLERREAVTEIETFDSPPTGLAFSPDGTRLAYTAGFELGGKLCMVDLRTGRDDILHWEQRGLFSLSNVHFLDGGKLVAYGSEDGVLYLRRSTDGKQVAALAGHLADIERNAIAVSSDGRMIATGSADTTVVVWDVSEFQERRADD